MTYRGWTLEAEDVLDLPLDELALRLLVDVTETATWNWRNWMMAAERHAYPGREDVLQVLGEAWQWLFNKGLVMPYDPVQSSQDAISVTRRRREVIARGFAWLRTTE